MIKETDFLLKMYEKYCPKKEVEDILCFTKEGFKWFDCIIKLKKEHETLEIIKRNPGVIISDIYTYPSWEEFCEDWVPNSDHFNSKEEFELVKEVLGI